MSQLPRLAGVVLLWASIARAQPATEPPPATEPQPAVPPVLDPVALAKRLDELEADNRHTHEALDLLRKHQAIAASHIKHLLPLSGRISGYLDFGFFHVEGDGSGIRSDIGHKYFPQYAGVIPDSWVFMGDPLSTTINSRGEPADTAGSRAIMFDSVNNKGKSSFIVNAVNLALFAGLSDELTLNTSVDFVPRGRDVSDPDGLFLGDFLDVKLAYAEYRPSIDGAALSLFAGKFDSVLGVEYRSQDAPDRLAVTPSLICRYTCGHPLGVKARAELFDKKLAINVAVTNGSHSVEQFPFADEIDTNQFKTTAGRISYRFPIGAGLEIGASGAFGAQDFQVSDSVYQWHVGGDLHLDWNDLDLSAELVHGRADGQTEVNGPPCGLAPCLHYTGAYGQLGYRATNWITPYLRVDWRDAVHASGASFVYISDLMRATAGAHFEIGTNTIVKVEYTYNRELGMPQFPDDIFTSALVVKY